MKVEQLVRMHGDQVQYSPTTSSDNIYSWGSNNEITSAVIVQFESMKCANCCVSLSLCGCWTCLCLVFRAESLPRPVCPPTRGFASRREQRGREGASERERLCGNRAEYPTFCGCRIKPCALTTRQTGRAGKIKASFCLSCFKLSLWQFNVCSERLIEFFYLLIYFVFTFI